MFGYYSYSDTLNDIAKAQRARENKKGVISSDAGWRNDSYGSASCASSTLSSIYEAYNEYRTCECY